jgi:DNA-binding CsgD family transcriptional regulator
MSTFGTQVRTFSLGFETVQLRASHGRAGVLLERETSAVTSRQDDVRITQVLLANQPNIRRFLETEPHKEIEPAVEQLVSYALSEPARKTEALRGDEILDAINQIAQIPDETALVGKVLSIAQALGANTAFFFLGQNDAQMQMQACRILATSPTGVAAVQVYVAKHWYATDPFLIRASKSHQPFFSSDVGFFENLTGSWHDMAEFARQFGLRSWIVAPAHNPRRTKFGALYASNSLLPSEQGEEVLRRNRLLFRELSLELLGWYEQNELALALAASGLSQLELSILHRVYNGETLDSIAQTLDVSKTALRERHIPSIRSKMSARTIVEAAKFAAEQGFLALASERKVVYVIHSPTFGIFLGEDLGVQWWSESNPEGLKEAAIFPDAASANRILDLQPRGHDCVLHRIDLHHAAQTASVEDCVRAGLHAWDPCCSNSGAPADDSGTPGTMGRSPASYH